MPIPPLNSVRLEPPQLSVIYSHAASEKLKSVARVVQTGPPALFAFPLPSLAHTYWQNRWFKSGHRNQSVFSFNHLPNPATVLICDFRRYGISGIRLLLRVPLADNFWFARHPTTIGNNR